MDLVDIDKVLDNLELNEEEDKDEKPAVGQLQNLNSAYLYTPMLGPVVSINEVGLERRNFLATAAAPTATGDHVNRFVGVSQVFSSLDDYRQNVESLEASLQLYTNNVTNDSDTFAEGGKTLNEQHANDDDVIRSPMVETDHDDDDDKNEIIKFVGTDEEHGFSSNSITTSSSSTFSSGPSPALLSTESELSFDVRLIDKSVLLPERRDDSAKQQLDNNKSEIESNVANNQNCDKEPDATRSEFDDLAVGLSSISLMNHASTLSSSEMASSKCILKIENLSSSLSLSQNTKNYMDSEELPEHQPKESVKQNNSQEQKRLEQAAHEHSQQNVMVTFGSTMDEISDTELDSILQEIDAEIPSQIGPETACTEQNAIAVETTKKKAKSDRKVSITSASHQESAMVIGDDAMNIDSFSQASTIEFAEDRTHNDDIDNCKGIDAMCENDSEEQKNINQNIAIAKRQRPTTLDLPVRKVNLYASAGQTPPGSRIYDHATSSSDEYTPEDRADLATNDDDSNLNDAAGHTPPRRSDRSIVSAATDLTVAIVEADNADVAFTSSEIESGSVGTAAAADEGAALANPTTVADADEYDNDMTSAENVKIEDEDQAMAAAAEEEASPTLPQPPSSSSQNSHVNPNLGRLPPIWVPDNEANACMQCQFKFTLLKRRHHCRSCGQVLCSICCSQKFKLEFLPNPESRVCVQCFLILTKQQQIEHQPATEPITTNNTPTPPLLRTPNPNNPMEYCSTIPPHRQVNSQTMSYPTVIVPVGVLKKEGTLKKSRKRKSVMFSDGIRPGSDLAGMDSKWSDAKHARKSVPSGSQFLASAGCTPTTGTSKNFLRNNPKKMVQIDGTWSFIPGGENLLPPICSSNKSDQVYQDVINNAELIARLQTETLKFAIQNNFFVFVKISYLKCCIKKTVIHFTTCGLHHVGNDEVIVLLELGNSNKLPKDIFVHLNEIYWEASKGRPITELGHSTPKDILFLGSRDHGGFLFIRSTFQCMQDMHIPTSPFLIGVLIHRLEVPWAKVFPLRLMLRLGAQYKYYPSPLISVRNREPVYAEIAQTIINLLADFRNYTYTLPNIKGMYIHMEDRRTNILLPRNRHDDVIKAINNSSDHILAMGANFSKKADGHLVCIQNLERDNTDSNPYSTQAINIHGQPRTVTGASFFVLNEALKSTSGLSGKCSIIEDGLMVQILPSKMVDIRNALVNMQDINIVCGPIEAGEQQTEVLCIQWVDDDVDINIGVRSPIDSREMDGIPSIRVHSGVNLSNTNHTIKWTEVFVVEISGDNAFAQCKSSVDISRISEQIAKNASVALLPFLDLLAANGNVKIGLRVTLNQDNVCYEAGSQNEKLPPLYMNALDNELIPTLHKQANEIGKIIVLELIFYILNV